MSEAPLLPWQVARDLRWRIVRGVLLDPFAWAGIAVLALATQRFGAAFAAELGWRPLAAVTASVLALAAVALGTGDALLFERPENDLLRTQPLGPRGLLTVRREELGWWSWPSVIVLAALAHGAAGWWAAAGLLLARIGLQGFALRSSLSLRSALGRRAPRAGLLLWTLVAALLIGAWLAPASSRAYPPWLSLAPGALFALLGLTMGRGLDAHFLRAYDGLASAAASAPPAPRGQLWNVLDRALPLPPPIKARLVRDLVLLLRGWDPRGAMLLSLSPLALLLLAGQLSTLKRPDSLLWWTLEAAALGGAAVAWAVGPAIHTLRNGAMAWERVAPKPGQRAQRAAMLYAFAFACLHGVLVLITVALVQDGRFTAEVPGLILPVLTLELAMAHYAVAFSMAWTLGRRIAGEPNLVLSMPFLAAGLALVAIFKPLLVPIYFVISWSFASRGPARYDSVEVTW